MPNMATRPVHERECHGMGVLRLYRDGAWSMRWQPRPADRRQRDRSSGHLRWQPRRRRGVARAVQYGRRVVVRDSSLAASTTVPIFFTVSYDNFRRPPASSAMPLIEHRQRYVSRQLFVTFDCGARRNSCSHLTREFTPTYAFARARLCVWSVWLRVLVRSGRWIVDET